MSDYPIIPVKGRMTDRQFIDDSVCLVTTINASSFKLSGIAKDLAEVYGYANLFENRKQLYNLKRVVWSDRPNVGSLVVKEPPAEWYYPIVVGMVTQFCQGDSVEYNDVSRYFIETSRDMHYVNGLMSDTKQSRRDNFKSCLNELGDYVKQKKNIRKVIFPTGVGRRGKMDHEWNVAYLKELRSFAHQLDLNNVKVMLLGQEEGTKNLPAKASTAGDGRQTQTTV